MRASVQRHTARRTIAASTRSLKPKFSKFGAFFVSVIERPPNSRRPKTSMLGEPLPPAPGGYRP